MNETLQKRPIHFAVESHSVENLNALLKNANLDINAPGQMLNTPVNSLCEQITDVNFRQIFPCIQLLVSQCSDINLPNQRGMTPILKILKNRHLNVENQKAVVMYMLRNAVDIDLDDETKSTLRDILPYFDVEYELSNRKSVKKDRSNAIKLKNEKVTKWNFYRLYNALKNKKEEDFLAGIDQVNKLNPESMNVLFTATEQRETLLIAAVSKNLNKATEKCVELGANINYSVPTEIDPIDGKISPLKSAVIRGHWKCLALLLKQPEIDLNSTPVLPLVVRNLGRKFSTSRKGTSFEKCFEMLLQNGHVDINQHDSANCTALHYSVKCAQHDATLQLLKEGAYFGKQNKLGELAISEIDAKVLKKHFDSCITANALRPSDDDFEIEFNFKNFVSLRKDRNDESYANEMAAIAYIAQSDDLKELVMHPIIQSFTSLRWRRLQILFWINFLLCAMWGITTIAYILIYYNNHHIDPMGYMMISWIFMLTLYVIGREIMQFIFSPRDYLTSVENFFEWTLIVLIMLILFDMYSENTRRTFAASTILLIAVEFFIICGSLPFWSFSTYYEMLARVALSFMKSLSLYSIILFSFAIAFFTLLHDPKKMSWQSPEGSSNGNHTEYYDDDDDDENDDNFNNFPNIGISIVKTFVMAAGEFDAADINFGENSFSIIVFIVFVLLVSIVLLNLLTGLAVSDTQVIKQEAELTDFIQNIQVLARYDRAMSRR